MTGLDGPLRARGWPAWLDEAWAARCFYAIAGLCVCAGTFVVLRELLHGDSFWFDEIYYLGLLRLPFDEAMSRRIRVDVHPPMYFFLLGAWTQAFGTSEVAVRSLSALGALGALAVLWWRGGGQASRAALALASLWLATNWMWVFYAREARMYGLALLGGCWLALAFARLWNLGREPFLRELWPFCLGALLLAFLHYSAMALACSALLLLLLRLRRRPGLWLPMVAAGGLCLAWAVWHGMHIHGGRHIPSLQVGSLPGPMASALVLWSLFLPGNSFPHNYSPSTPPVLLAWAGLLCVYGLVAGAWIRQGLLRQDSGQTRPEDPDRAMLRSQLLLLAVFFASVSLVHEYRPVLMQKVVVVALPSLALCVGCVGAILWRGKVWVLCSLALALGGISLPLAVHGLDERWLRGFPYHRDGFRELALRQEQAPSRQRVYCFPSPHMIEAFWDSQGLARRHPHGLGAVTQVRPRDTRHLIPPLFVVGPPQRIERRFGEGLGFEVRALGAADGGYPMDSTRAFRAYHLAPGDGAGHK